MNLNASPAFFKQLYQFEEVYQLADTNTFAVWILVAYPAEKLMPEATLAFLHKILGAVGLKTQDFYITNVGIQGWENHSLASPIAYRQVWGFGNAIKIVFPTLSLTDYSAQEVENILYLQAESLEVIQPDTQRKTKLWQALKQII